MPKILLAISGSISFYKAYEILSELKKRGVIVKILLSDGALGFCTQTSFEALASDVLSSQNESWLDHHNHIAYTKDCDAIVLAPASANTINKLANGIADNVFIQTLIASTAPLLIAPAANTNMLNHHSTRRSLKLLQESGATILSPVCKRLACGDVGMGALANVEDIVDVSLRMVYANPIISKNSQTSAINSDLQISGAGGATNENSLDDKSVAITTATPTNEISFDDKSVAITTATPTNEILRGAYAGKKVLVSAGGCIESIDAVRCISNHSSGKMGERLAMWAYYLGAQVVLASSRHTARTLPNTATATHNDAGAATVTTTTQNDADAQNASTATVAQNNADKQNTTQAGYQVLPYQSSEQLKQIINEHCDFDYLFMAAAVSDFVPSKCAHKISKKDHPNGLDLHLNPNEDLLAQAKFRGKKIGFKLENNYDIGMKNASAALSSKHLDMICLNTLEDSALFGDSTNTIYLLSKSGASSSHRADKDELARYILDKARYL